MKTLINALLIIISFALLSNAHAHSEAALAVDGHLRSFVYAQPQTTPPPEGWPVLFLFHGAMQNGDSWFRAPRLKAFMEKALGSGFYIIAPNSLIRDTGTTDNFLATFKGPRWNLEDIPRQPLSSDSDYGNDDINFIGALLDYAENQMFLDSSRIYFTGFSSGAGITMLSAMIFTSRIKAASINSGGYIGNMSFEIPTEGHPPMLIKHGMHDFVVDYECSVEYARDLKDAGIEMKLNLVKNMGHFWLSRFDEEVLAWFNR